MALNDPVTADEWRAVGLERSDDANSLQRASRELAALYFLGFAAESFAKAVLAGQAEGSTKKVPQIHDIILLLEQAGIARAKVPAKLREAAEVRDVSLRYQVKLSGAVPADCFESTMQLVSWLSRRATRAVDARMLREVKRQRIAADRFDRRKQRLKEGPERR